MKRSFVLSSLAFLFTAIAFLGTAAAADPAPAAPAADKKVDWEHMSLDDRKKLMKAKVQPELKKAFQAADHKRYKKFSCGTCHGEGATNGKFKMPNPELPKLPAPTDRAGFMALQQKKPEIVKFMGTVVKPKVAEILGLPEWTPQNPQGFGCYQCHTAEGAK